MVNSRLVDRQPLLNVWLVLGSLATATTFVFLLCFFFEPKWETNDDVAMSMIAHGYGAATIGLPNLIFSNVLWGYLVRTIPEINGTLGYSIATLSVLVIVGAVIIYSLYQLGVNHMTCLLILALMLIRPVLFPQFTINAGLLMVAAVICWHLYIQQNDRRILVVGCLLAFFSYLVRSQEFLLVLFVALPLLAWRTLFLHRFARIVFLVLVSAITVSAVIDYQAYQGIEWIAFNELNPARAPFTDFGAGMYLKQHPDILQRYGYSNNDIDLITNWFFVDPNIANPRALRLMLAELGHLPDQGNALVNAWIGVQALWHPNLLPLVLTALLLTVLRPSWQVMAGWVLCVSAIFLLGFLGRPGILRVYVPLVSLLLVAPFLMKPVSTWRNCLGVVLLIVAMLINASHVFSESRAFKIITDQTQKDLINFPSNSVIAWGASFPFEAAYPVLGISSSAMSYKLYGLGCFTLAPFSRSFIDQKSGRNLIDLLSKETDVPIIAHVSLFKYLEIYCKEHLHGQLKELSVKQYGEVVISQRQCEVTP